MLWKFGQGRHGSHWKDQVTTCFFSARGLCFPVSHSTLSKLPDSHPTETLHYRLLNFPSTRMHQPKHTWNLTYLTWFPRYWQNLTSNGMVCCAVRVDNLSFWPLGGTRNEQRNWVTGACCWSISRHNFWGRFRWQGSDKPNLLLGI